MKKKRKLTARFKDDVEGMGICISNIIAKSRRKFDEIVIVCVGTDRITGDSLGPLIGTLLNEMYNMPCRVLGSLESPIHAKNINEIVGKIDPKKSFIIGIDACLGSSDDIGVVCIGKHKLEAGAGLKKEGIIHFGDICIMGVVNVGGFMEFSTLQNTRLLTIYTLAQQICKGLDIGLNSEACASKVRGD